MNKVSERVLPWSIIALMALACSGCMQVETRVKLEEDGGATVTERVRLSNRILDNKMEGGKVADLNSLLTKPAAERRAKQLGEGCTLASHQVKDVPGGKEVFATYKIADVNNLKYVSPYLAYVDYAQNNTVRFKLEPVYKSRPYQGAKAGQMAVSLVFEKAPKEQPRPEKDKPPPPGPAPKDMQTFRDLMPAVRDMLEGFELRLTFEPYCAITHSGYGLRNRQAQPKEIDLFWFNDKQLDKYGNRFLENEEVCLALARLDFGNAKIVDQMRDFSNNTTMPVFRPDGADTMWWGGGTEVCFAPSKALFDKLFTGKELNYNEWAENPKDKKVPADFSKIGWKGEGK